MVTNDKDIIFIMSINDEVQLLDKNKYSNIRNGIIKILSLTDDFEKINPWDIENPAPDEKIFSEIDEEIEYHVGDKHIISDLLKQQLYELKRNQFVSINDSFYPYNIKLIYWTMEKIISNDKSLTAKEFTRPKSQLSGLNIYHVHHNQSNSINKNATRFFKRYYRYEAFRDKIIQLKKKRLNPTVRNLLSDFIYTVLMDSLNDSSKDDWERTGEWIVYQKNNSGIINFLCLSTHSEGYGNGAILYNKIKNLFLPSK